MFKSWFPPYIISSPAQKTVGCADVRTMARAPDPSTSSTAACSSCSSSRLRELTGALASLTTATPCPSTSVSTRPASGGEVASPLEVARLLAPLQVEASRRAERTPVAMVEVEPLEWPLHTLFGLCCLLYRLLSWCCPLSKQQCHKWLTYEQLVSLFCLCWLSQFNREKGIPAEPWLPVAQYMLPVSSIPCTARIPGQLRPLDAKPVYVSSVRPVQGALYTVQGTGCTVAGST